MAIFYKVGDVIKDEKRDLTITSIIITKNHKNQNAVGYKYKCNKCGFDCGEHYKDGVYYNEYILTQRNLRRGTGGICCCKNKHAVVTKKNSISVTDKYLVDDYGLDENFAEKHSIGSGKKGKFTCKDCGNSKLLLVSDVRVNKSIFCNCGDGFSYPEKFMNSLLKQLEISFETQYSPDYLIRNEGGKNSRKYSDFYLSEYNLIIEVDGGMNHKDGKVHSKSIKNISEYIEVDEWKDKQHFNHGIKTIRINCFKSEMGYIKNNILNSELSQIFDLSKISWIECEKFALKNIVKEVCDYWDNKNKDETTTNLIDRFNLSKSFIVSALNKGNKHGWCNYNSREELKKNSIKANESTSKSVEIFKEGQFLGVFKSMKDLDKKSEDMFNVKLDFRSISLVCLGKQKSYKGFTFKTRDNDGNSDRDI